MNYYICTSRLFSFFHTLVIIYSCLPYIPSISYLSYLLPFSPFLFLISSPFFLTTTSLHRYLSLPIILPLPLSYIHLFLTSFFFFLLSLFTSTSTYLISPSYYRHSFLPISSSFCLCFSSPRPLAVVPYFLSPY